MNDYLSHHGVLGQHWGVRNGPPYPLKSSRRQVTAPKNTKYLKDYSGPALFVSSNSNLSELNPRVPDNYFTKNGYEDSKTPRVSFAPSIDKCLAGLSQNLDGKTFTVYSPDEVSNYKVFKPNKKAVPDSSITDEMWICEPVKLKRVGEIKITGNQGKPGVKFSYGDKEAELFNDWTYDIIKHSELYHHGVKGMHWGVRRYQNKDGSYTKEGKERRVYYNRARRAATTKNDMDRLYNLLSKEDKRLLGDDEGSKEWLTTEEGEFVVKRFLTKNGDIPIAALDIMTTTKNGHLTVALMTNPEYRGSGEASKLAKKGYDWFTKNADKYGATSLGWGAYANNKASRRIAEKTGFVYNNKISDDEWSVYDYKVKKKK